MQDMEFAIHTEVFPRGRRHLGSVGLGGNGKYIGLSALLSLGPAPWTQSLTEDLDVGVRLLTAGWRDEYCPTTAVHQQDIVKLRRLIRQRSRWFQGHLQSWRLIPRMLRNARAMRRAVRALFAERAQIVFRAAVAVALPARRGTPKAPADVFLATPSTRSGGDPWPRRPAYRPGGLSLLHRAVLLPAGSLRMYLDRRAAL